MLNRVNTTFFGKDTKMKKKIISLVLVAVLVVTALVSCSYDVTKDDVDQYATFSTEAFNTALKSIKIHDLDYTNDVETRKDRVVDAIRTTLKTYADKTKEGTPEAGDVLYYCYYVVADGITNAYEGTFFTKYMNVSNVQNVQLGLSTYEEGSFQALLLEALADADFEFIKDVADDEATTDVDETVVGNSYKTTSGKDVKVEDGDDFYVSFTVKYTTGEGEDAKTHTETYKNIKVEAGIGTTQSPFYQVFVGETANGSTKVKGKTAGAESETETFDVVMDGTVEDLSGQTVTISNATVSCIVENEGEELIIEVDADKHSFGTTAQDAILNSESLSGKKLTYHVFPVEYADVPTVEYDSEGKLPEELADIIIKEVFGKKITGTSLEIFDNEELKTSQGETLKTLVDGKKVTGDDGKEKEDSTFPSLATLIEQAAKSSAKDEDKEALETRLAAIYALAPKAQVVESYEKSVKEGLEDAYNEGIKSAIAAEIVELIDEHFKLKANVKLPKRAVNDIYDIIMQNHKATFHNGTYNETTGQSYYSYYGGSFNKYLMASVKTDEGTAAATYDEALACVKAQAEDLVLQLIKYQLVAEQLDCVLTAEEFEDKTYNDFNYWYYETLQGSYFGDYAFRLAWQFDKILDKLLLMEGEEAAIKAYEDKVAAGDTEAVYEFEVPTVTADGKVSIKFVNVVYTIEEE